MELLKNIVIRHFLEAGLFARKSPSDIKNERPEFLSTLPVTPKDRYFASMVVIASLVFFLGAAPFAKTQLVKIWAFIPIYESALIMNDLITAVLLFGQFSILRSKALCILASGYLFTAFMIVSHALTFPGLFSSTGLLGAGPQSTAWLYMFWHGGFPLFVIAYVLFKDAERKTAAPPIGPNVTILFHIVLVVVAVCGFTLLATAGQSALPGIMLGHHYTPAMIIVVSTVWMLSLLALICLWRQHQHSALDVWLMVAICAWIFDIALSAVLNAGRFDLGFYVGRIYGLLAASIVLMVLLLENCILYAKLFKLHKSEHDKTIELTAANQELEAFSYSVSHDLRAPLRAVKGYAKMLTENHSGQLNAEGNRLLGIVYDRSLRMEQLIDDLLAYSRLGRQPLKTRPVQLDEFIKQIIEELQPDYNNRKIEFIVDHLGETAADPTLLKQALANLLSNAIKYTRNVSTAIIEIGCLENTTSNEKTYYVKDNGAGFDMRYADKLFGVFQRLHREDEFEGTGVGLAIVQRIINRHGGKVWADSKLHEGTTFYFTLV